MLARRLGPETESTVGTSNGLPEGTRLRRESRTSSFPRSTKEIC